MKIWKIHKIISEKDRVKRRETIIKSILLSRGLKTKKQIEEFLNPRDPSTFDSKSLDINKRQLSKAIKRIKTAIADKQQIIVYGDYDADGICATAILWETLHKLGANAMPFIPHRKKHGYGISKKGIDEILSNLSQSSKPLIITVDNGIVAHDAIKYANKQKVDVIVSDHHVSSETIPPASAIVHTTKLAGAGVAWVFAYEIAKAFSKQPANNLELAAIGSLADMVPLLGANRSIVSHGLNKLKKTKRIGLLQLFKEVGINIKDLGTYEINFIIAPRLNAMGRLGHAMDSLRLLCTKRKDRAKNLAQTLSETNRDRQELTESQLTHAKEISQSIVKTENIIIVGHEDYHEGVIGLIAGKLVESYWRPAIVLSRGKTTSKASARSIPGFNIIETLRQVSDLLVDVGGHPMAAGFTIENNKIDQLTKRLQEIAHKEITSETLKKTLDINCQIKLSDINWELFNQLKQFEPFGIANSRPVFATKGIKTIEARPVGGEKQHLKLTVEEKGAILPGIGFRFGKLAEKISAGNQISLAYTIDKNEWNGRRELQLKIKDLKPPRFL